VCRLLFGDQQRLRERAEASSGGDLFDEMICDAMPGWAPNATAIQALMVPSRTRSRAAGTTRGVEDLLRSSRDLGPPVDLHRPHDRDVVAAGLKLAHPGRSSLDPPSRAGLHHAGMLGGTDVIKIVRLHEVEGLGVRAIA
jgi:hypothetical protein